MFCVRLCWGGDELVMVFCWGIVKVVKSLSSVVRMLSVVISSIFCGKNSSRFLVIRLVRIVSVLVVFI